MEYLTRLLLQLDNLPSFKYHSKCERMKITSLTFADDLLLFARGDLNFVDLLLAKVSVFTNSTGLHLNPNKCFIYFGGVEHSIRDAIREHSGFMEGVLPFRYLGLPLTSKKLAVKHYLVPIEKIVQKVTHWSSKLLTYAGRVMLIKSVLFAVVNFWMQVLPLPKADLHRIDSICRSFLWTGDKVASRKSPLAWKKVWNLNRKTDSLWIKWIHEYYLKNADIMQVPIKESYSWLSKKLLHARQLYQELDASHAGRGNKIQLKSLYIKLLATDVKPVWKHLMFGNFARPRSVFIFWLACNGRLATKERMKRFGLIQDDRCVFCSQQETIGHLFFCCIRFRNIWERVLNWINITHSPIDWDRELVWTIRNCKGRSWRATLLKSAITEIVYALWKVRNEIVFGLRNHIGDIDKEIIDILVYRLWNAKKYRKHLVMLML
ncbi:uncharacterized protein LOC131613201 [Vicia villosa]|uniref:uncharacterized protein LOC131613201 n=1 Tax=Vicia villosa TaxID=3911 RepID=UPI00273B8A65|nr:uncharacterized protein LOC131613201 [Vicia villosa]